jgi:hypothetical protein
MYFLACLVLSSFLGNFSLTFLGFYKRLFGKHSASGRRRNAGELWATVAPVRSTGCPQACPVVRTVVHGGRVHHVAPALMRREAASFSR